MFSHPTLHIKQSPRFNSGDSREMSRPPAWLRAPTPKLLGEIEFLRPHSWELSPTPAPSPSASGEAEREAGGGDPALGRQPEFGRSCPTSLVWEEGACSRRDEVPGDVEPQNRVQSGAPAL